MNANYTTRNKWIKSITLDCSGSVQISNQYISGLFACFLSCRGKGWINTINVMYRKLPRFCCSPTFSYPVYKERYREEIPRKILLEQHYVGCNTSKFPDWCTVWSTYCFSGFASQRACYAESVPCHDVLVCWYLWPLLLIWFNFNPSMDK